MKLDKKKKTHSTRKCITVIDNPNFALVESYKSLRTNIMFSLPASSSGCRKIMFTSSNPRDGKTTTCVNIAITLAQAKMRVLLIDADMRKPTVHKYFGLESRTGLSNALSGMNKFDDCIKKVQKTENLWVITSGVLPPNPSELLSSTSMAQMLEKLEESFDYIIIDSPPINVVTDALAMVKMVDGVIVVTAQNVTRYPELKKSIASLEFAEANIIGIVLNRVKASKTRYGKSYNYSYKYKYYKTPSADSENKSAAGVGTEK